ncbi:lamin tail domain-containing protein [Candidatus Nomurabacteria bacterium]|nr:lamin tail domain-containing protein [Candidatus Nomurabacteria bacterium]
MKTYRLTTTFTIMSLAFLALPTLAGAYFTGEAEATANTFNIGTLDVSVDNETHSVNVDSSSSEDFSFTTNDLGTIASQYKISATPTVCSSAFFNGLNVEVTQGSVVYDGALSALNATSSNEGLWTVVVTAGSLMVADNEQCEVELTLSAWQTEFPLWNTGGFSEEITMTLTVTATEDIGPQPTSNVVLNEVYAHPNNASSTPYDIEWIELYNGTGSSVDVANWSIGEMTGVNTNQHEIVSSCPGSNPSDYMEPLSGSSTIIPAGGLMVFKFCGNASYLNQGSSGDTVTLHMSTSSAAIDTYNYTSTQLGKSDARIPDGGTWVDPIPSPGESNMSTITVEDLEAENWPDELIAEVMGIDTKKEVVPVSTPTNVDGEEDNDDIPLEIPNTEENDPTDPGKVDDDEDKESSDIDAGEGSGDGDADTESGSDDVNLNVGDEDVVEDKDFVESNDDNDVVGENEDKEVEQDKSEDITKKDDTETDTSVEQPSELTVVTTE